MAFLASVLRSHIFIYLINFNFQLDMLSWFMEEATEEESTDWNLARRILAINFAAVHTTSMVPFQNSQCHDMALNAFTDICAYAILPRGPAQISGTVACGS